MSDRAAPHPDHAVYAISVAAELSGVGVQSLRLYEAHGLVAPRRTSGGTRRYSSNDVATVGRITDLLADGLNLAGISRVLALETENGELRTENAELRADRDGRAARGHSV